MLFHAMGTHESNSAEDDSTSTTWSDEQIKKDVEKAFNPKHYPKKDKMEFYSIGFRGKCKKNSSGGAK